MTDVFKIDDGFKYEYRGKEYFLPYAPLDLMTAFDEKLEKLEVKDHIGLTYETLEKNGCDKDVLKTLPPKAAVQLLEKAFGLEKK